MAIFGHKIVVQTTMRTLLVLVLFGLLPATGQEADFATNGYLNGKAWKTFTSHERIVYLKAFIEAMSLTRTELNGKAEAIKKGLDVPDGFIIGDYIAELKSSTQKPPISGFQ